MNRYSRHQNLFGEKGFEALNKASVLVAGAGGLGCSVLNLLVRLGIGTVHFYEFDEISLSDLNRQILYNTDDIGLAKCETAYENLQKINPDIHIIPHCERISKNTQIPEVDLVFDCLDNFTSRYILDDLIFPMGIPMIHAGASSYFGQLTVIHPEKTKCLRQTITVDATNFDKNIDKQVFPPLVQTMASLQVSQGVKYLTGDFKHLYLKEILVVDFMSNSFDVIKLH